MNAADPVPMRCQTNLTGHGGECIFCQADQGEVCQKARSGRLCHCGEPRVWPWLSCGKQMCVDTPVTWAARNRARARRLAKAEAIVPETPPPKDGADTKGEG